MIEGFGVSNMEALNALCPAGYMLTGNFYVLGGCISVARVKFRASYCARVV